MSASDVGMVTLVPSGAWEVDAAGSSIGFEVRHLKIAKVHGCFHQVTGAIRCDGEGFVSIDGSVEVASIDTGDPRRDARLRAGDFFDAERHPTIAITATAAPARGGATPAVNGTLTVRGVSRPLELALDPSAWHAREGDERRIRASGAVSRSDFGLTWDSAFAAGGLVIDDRVRLELDVAVRPAD